MPANTPRGYPYPLYTDLNAFPAQIQALATAVDADMDALWDRLIAGYNQPAVYVRGTGNQAIANNTGVTATYTTEVYDNAGMFTIGTSATNVNILTSGVYIVTGRVSYTANGAALAGARQISLVSSGALGVLARRSIQADFGTFPPAGSTVPAVTNVGYMAAGTVLTMVHLQNSGATIQSATRTLAAARIGGL